ncbi:MAG TPA: 3-hydroxybutyrate dehydrogenase [Oceanithermus profundus]|uniref:3-hydroxybutyrate dehydrogenase n=1 Tax=Oceanithermus profundus TaxID=187137 RepID=A0A7C4ZHG5_9DEIN|nr:3-hydroxybutyrate dehydrogenase [Oceanithermus profundus]
MEEARVALVTGAAGGIGRAVAERLAAEGLRVVVHDRETGGREVAEALGGVFVQADLSDPKEVWRLAVEAERAYGRVDVLVNNAGFQHVAPLERFPLDVWQAMQQVMVTAPFQLIRSYLKGMKERRWGRIVNLGSIHSLVASPYKAAYATAKHALLGLTRAAALEAGEAGVTVNAVCPAYVRTPLVERQIADQARNLGLEADEVVQRVMLEPAAIKRLIEPEEVAALVAYLVSDAAGAVSGACLPIDLGWTAR